MLVYAGAPITKPGGHDQTYSFLPHPDYYWLTGLRRPSGVAAFTKATGWVEFALPVSREERIWEGDGETITGLDVAGLKNWIATQKPQRTFLLGQYLGHEADGKFDSEVQEWFSQARRIKDAEEIALVSKLAGMANIGYQTLRELIRAGISERQVQIEYETAVLRAGAEKFPYDSIVGTGTNSAILHAIPTPRILKDGEHVLIDAGADVADYCVDITRNFPVNGKWSERQKLIYELVKKDQSASIALCSPGSEWKDVHLASARVIAGGLKDLGILKIDQEEALESGAVGAFFPHGVGHMVGLRVRDVGGPPNPNPKKYAGARLRVDMKLEEGFLMTVEPGLYFIPTLLDDEQTRTDYKDVINWTEVEKWKDFGGIRIEDDIHITAQGPVNLTSMVEK